MPSANISCGKHKVNQFEKKKQKKTISEERPCSKNELKVIWVENCIR